MSILLFKLTAGPLLIALVTQVTRRFGPLPVAGLSVFRSPPDPSRFSWRLSRARTTQPQQPSPPSWAQEQSPSSALSMPFARQGSPDS